MGLVVKVSPEKVLLSRKFRNYVGFSFGNLGFHIGASVITDV